MPNLEIQKLEQELYKINEKLILLRKQNTPQEVKNYTFQTLDGETALLDLFTDKDTLFVIHNMGKGCDYCTLWADGLSPFVPYLQKRFAVALVSKDSPQTQQEFATSREWKFPIASHGGGDYIKEQTVADSDNVATTNNYPGIVCYERKGNLVFRKNATSFGPGDEFCSVFNILSLAGLSEGDWSPA